MQRLLAEGRNAGHKAAFGKIINRFIYGILKFTSAQIFVIFWQPWILSRTKMQSIICNKWHLTNLILNMYSLTIISIYLVFCALQSHWNKSIAEWSLSFWLFCNRAIFAISMHDFMHSRPKELGITRQSKDLFVPSFWLHFAAFDFYLAHNLELQWVNGKLILASIALKSYVRKNQRKVH